jgi:hypothetical protein
VENIHVLGLKASACDWRNIPISLTIVSFGMKAGGPRSRANAYQKTNSVLLGCLRGGSISSPNLTATIEASMPSWGVGTLVCNGRDHNLWPVPPVSGITSPS